MVACLLAAAATASEAGAPPESRVTVQPTPSRSDGFTFLAIAQAKAVGTNLTSTNPFLDGQVVGVLGGTNGITVAEEKSFYTEQRLSAFFTYAPPILDGRVALTTAFELDFGWGDKSYGVGGNTGGAFGADMVNLQTRRFHVTMRPLIGKHDLTLYAGLQFVGDGPFDPTTSRPDDLFRTSGRLMIVGSEATGLSAYGRVGGGGGTWLRYRLGSFTLYEVGVTAPDDVTLHVADLRVEPTWNTGFGVHALWLRDRSAGNAGTLGIGPASALSEIQGGPRLDFREGGAGEAPALEADVMWLAADLGWNHRLDRGPFGASGVVATNVGKFYLDGQPDPSIAGLMADGEVRARWTRGEGSVVRAEALFTSADDPGDPAYTGFMTANTWGTVGALNGTHGGLLLFPDPFSINRYTAVVHDISNAGRGVVGLGGTVGYDLIPNRVTTTVGVQTAQSAGDTVGTELHAHFVTEPWLFFKLGLHAGTVLATDLPEDPWMVYTSLDWVVFR